MERQRDAKRTAQHMRKAGSDPGLLYASGSANAHPRQQPIAPDELVVQRGADMRRQQREHRRLVSSWTRNGGYSARNPVRRARPAAARCHRRPRLPRARQCMPCAISRITRDRRCTSLPLLHGLAATAWLRRRATTRRCGAASATARERRARRAAHQRHLGCRIGAVCRVARVIKTTTMAMRWTSGSRWRRCHSGRCAFGRHEVLLARGSERQLHSTLYNYIASYAHGVRPHPVRRLPDQLGGSPVRPRNRSPARRLGRQLGLHAGFCPSRRRSRRSWPDVLGQRRRWRTRRMDGTASSARPTRMTGGARQPEPARLGALAAGAALTLQRNRAGAMSATPRSAKTSPLSPHITGGQIAAVSQVGLPSRSPVVKRTLNAGSQSPWPIPTSAACGRGDREELPARAAQRRGGAGAAGRDPGQQRGVLPRLGFPAARALLRADAPRDLRGLRQDHPRRQDRDADHRQDLPARAADRRRDDAAISRAARRGGDHRHQRRRLRPVDLRPRDPPQPDPDRRGDGRDGLRLRRRADRATSRSRRPKSSCSTSPRRAATTAASSPSTRRSREAITMAGEAYSRDGTLSGTATGLTDLDRLMGGLQRSDLIILAGPSGDGQDLARHQHRLPRRQDLEGRGHARRPHARPSMAARSASSRSK